MAEKLSLLNESSDSEVEFKVNKNYADRYDKWRHKEELQKLQAICDNHSDTSSSESEEEEVPEIEEDFLKTLSLLKGKDPKIYNQNVTFFKNDGIKEKQKVKKVKPLFIKDYERKLILEKNGVLSDDEEHIPYQNPSYDEEQIKLRDSFKAVLNEDSSEEDDGGLLQVRQKTKSEVVSDEADYLLWLKGQKDSVSDETEKDMSFLRKFWDDPEINDDEKFLKDYILNKRYMEEDKSGKIPTYDEITEDIGTLSDDEKVIQQQEAFEHKYNFRFEEPDTEFIKRYPRTIGDSLRRTENKRKIKRETYAERKKKEKEQQREDLKRLKALKRKEIEEKFEKIKDISGYEELNLNEVDMEGDFDPEKHDQKMKELFNDQYYGVEEEQKPEFCYDEELDTDNWDLWTGECSAAAGNSTSIKNQGTKSSDDSDSDGEEVKKNPKLEFQNEMIQSSLTGKKRVKKKSLFAKMISKPKPVFDADGKSFEEYLDDYYKLDYEDMIGDMPVRYRYRKVMPNNFGLSVDEILTANDKELNRWCSVKKASQFRSDQEELYDVQSFQKKAQNLFTKKKYLPSLFMEPEDNQDDHLKTTTKHETTEKKCKAIKNKEIIVEADEDNKSITTLENSPKIQGASNCLNEKSMPERESESINPSLCVKAENSAENTSTSKKLKRKRKSKDLTSTASDNQITSSQDGDQKTNKHLSFNKHKCLKSSHNQNEIQASTSSENNQVIEFESSNKLEYGSKELKCDQKSVAFMLNNNPAGNNENTNVTTKHKKKKKAKDITNDTTASEVKTQASISSVNKQFIEAVPSRMLESTNEKPEPNHTLKLVDSSLNGNVEINSENIQGSKKRKRKKKKKSKSAANITDNQIVSNQNSPQQTGKQFSSNKNKRFRPLDTDKRLTISDERLKAYGINPKKFKGAIKYSKKF